MSDEAAAVRLIKSAYGALALLKANLPPGYSVSIDQEEEIVAQALSQHAAHLKFHQIEQKSLDPFKFVCWMGGCFLAGIERGEGNTSQCEAVIDSILHSLEELLIVESEAKLILPASSAILLKSMLLQEHAKNGAHGIWMNGLYVSFHCTCASYEEAVRRQIKYN